MMKAGLRIILNYPTAEKGGFSGNLFLASLVSLNAL